MSYFPCLSEIEEPYILHSKLTWIEKSISIYCVLIKNYLIIYKKSNDIISLVRLPLVNKTKFENNSSQNRFTLVISNYRWNFNCEDNVLLDSWIQEIEKQIEANKVLEPLTHFDNAEVKIDRFSSINQNVYILISNNDYKLYVFESLDYHRFDIVTHVINLKYYTITNSRAGSTSFKLVGPNVKFKFTFKDEALAIKWKDILLSAINNLIVITKKDVLADIYANESNRFCADCGSPNPDWMSANLCITICLNCAGIHRLINTSFTCIQATDINRRVSDYFYLPKLLQEIGNQRSNIFWLKNKLESDRRSSEDPNFIIDKYAAKVYIDKEFSSLSDEEIKNLLKKSVSRKDVFSTARLWFSMHVPCDNELTDVLLSIARDSNQILQEKFLSLNVKSSKSDQHVSMKNSDCILQIGLNHNDKLNNLFLVSLTKTVITIRLQVSNEIQTEIIDVCTVNFDDIRLMWYDVINDSLVVSICPPVEFVLDSQASCVEHIFFSNSSKWILANFKNELIRTLFGNDFLTLTDDSNLFVNLLVKLNDDDAIKCKCHMTDSEIFFSEPVSKSFSLKNSHIDHRRDDGGESLLVKVNVNQLEFVISNAYDLQIVHNCLRNCSKSIKLLTEDESIPAPIDKMISFIALRGLLSDGIFRNCGTTTKISRLYASMIERDDSTQFSIDPNVYHVNDVASCLKKYFRSFEEPIIVKELFDDFYEASRQQDDQTKIDLYQQAVDRLPKLNYHILRRILELFLMIRLSEKNNRMNSDSLSVSTASSFISFETFNIQKSMVIMKDLIEHFEKLFNYSQDNTLFNIILQRRSSVDVVKMRTFYVSAQLMEWVKVKNFEMESLNFVGKESSFAMIHMSVGECITVKDVCDRIFTDVPIEIWHFLTKISKFSNVIVKRLVYLNEPTSTAVIQARMIPEYNGYFVIVPNQTSINLMDRRLFQCDVKVKWKKYRDCTVIMSFPHILQIYDKKANEPIHDFLISELATYRPHLKNLSYIIILHGLDGLLKLKFSSCEDLKEFLYYYDKFKNHIIHIN